MTKVGGELGWGKNFWINVENKFKFKAYPLNNIWNIKQAQMNICKYKCKRERSKLGDLTRFGSPPTSSSQEHLLRILKSTNLTSEDKTL